MVKSSLEVSTVNNKVSNLWVNKSPIFAAFHSLGHALLLNKKLAIILNLLFRFLKSLLQLILTDNINETDVCMLCNIVQVEFIN